MKKYIFIASAFICFATSIIAQKSVELANFQFNKLDEKIVLNTDKDLYLAGQQIWFSGIYMQNSQISDNDLSKVLYVELFNAKKDIIWQGKFSIENSVSSGEIDIPAEIFSGTYYLRAYTQFQKNMPPEYYFTKAIQIINPSVLLPASNQMFEDEIIISPAGGFLLPNIENFIALRMQGGLTGMLSSIWISDQYGNDIAKPLIYKNGLGYVYLTPLDTLQYTVKMAFRDGDTLTMKLPNISKSGLVLSVKHKDNGLNFGVQGNIAPTESNQFHLKVISEEEKEVVDTVFSNNQILLKSTHFKSQVYLGELINSENQIVAKQYFYGTIEAPEPILINTDKQTYNQREKVELSIENDKLDENSIISISVTEHGTNDLNSKHLPNYLLDNPMLIPYYLETAQPLDSLALKQLDIIFQFSSYPFKNIFTEKTISSNWPPETSDVNIAALLRYKKSKEPISGRTVYVSVLGSEPQLHANKTLSNGMVYFSLTHSTDTRDVFLSAESGPEEEIELLVLNDFSNKFPDLTEVPLEIDTTYGNQLAENWKTLQVENHYQVLEKLKSKEELPLPSRFGEPDYHVETKDFIELSNVEELFKELIPYTRLKKKAGEYYFEVMNPEKNVVYDHPLILIDDVPLFNYTGLAKLPFLIIESVDVYNKQYIYGDFVFDGVVLINTKTDNFAGLLMSYGSVFAVYKTITPEVIIQFPEYTADTSKQSRLPDFRTMLFWKPEVKLTVGKTNFSFFTSDYTVEYDVVIQGVTEDGKPCFGTTSFQVVSGKSE